MSDQIIGYLITAQHELARARNRADTAEWLMITTAMSYVTAAIGRLRGPGEGNPPTGP